jgi:hypothetical protein
VDVDHSCRLVRVATNLRINDFAAVDSKVHSLHARSLRTCHPSESHVAVAVMKSQKVLCPSLDAIDCPSMKYGSGHEHNRRDESVRRTNVRRSRGWIR